MKNNGFFKFLLKLIGFSLASLFIINKLIDYIVVTKRASIKDTFLEYNWRFGTVKYKKIGSGPPLLLIHDLDIGRSMNQWNNLVHSLSKKNTVYLIDLLGCGQSNKPHILYTDFLYVQLINDFITNIIQVPTDIIVSGKSAAFPVAASNFDDTLIKGIVLLSPTEIDNTKKITTLSLKVIKKIIFFPVIGTAWFNYLKNRDGIKYHSDDKYLFFSLYTGFMNINLQSYLDKNSTSINILCRDDEKKTMEKYQQYLPAIEILTYDNVNDDSDIVEQIFLLINP